MRFIMKCVFLLLLGFSLNVSAQQNTGGSDGVKNTCEVSGGTFTGSEGGNWACCWSDWGCYGCVDGNCKMQCRTARCRKANGVARPSSTNTNSTSTPVKGLAPADAKPPFAPVHKPTVDRMQN